MASKPAIFGPRNRDDCRPEQIIVPTVFDAPSVTSEQGLLPGIPAADSGNLARGVSLNLRGGYRQDRAYPGPTVKVRIEQPGTVRAPLSVDAEALIASGASVDQVIAAVNGAVHRRIQRGAVNRRIDKVSILRENNDGVTDPDYLGVREAFAVWPDGSHYIGSTPPGESGAWQFRDSAPMIEKDEALYLITLSTLGLAGDGIVRVLRYDPLLESFWSEYAQSSRLALLTHPSISELPVAATAVVVGEQIYAAVAVLRETGTGAGCFYFLRLRGTEFVLVGHGINTQRSRIDGGITMCPHPSGDGAIIAFGTREGVVNYKREIGFAVSADMQTWPDDSLSSALHLPNFSDLQTTRLLRSSNRNRQISSKVAFASRTAGALGFDVDEDGFIWGSSDGGRSWSRQSSPAEAGNNTLKQRYPLHCVSVNGTTAYAVGDGGLILKTTNSGTTWKVVRYGARKPLSDLWATAQIDATLNAATATDVLDWDLYGVQVDGVDANKVWICGQGGLLLYSDNGGSSFTVVQNLNNQGAYFDLIVDQNNNALLVGDEKVHDVDSVAAADRHTRIALFQNAHTAAPTVTRYVKATVDGDNAAFVAITRASTTSLVEGSAYCYALTADGYVHRWLGNGTTGGNWEQVASLGPGTFYDIDSPANKSIVLVAGEHEISGGTVWRSDDADANYSTDPVAPSFTPQKIIVGSTPTSLWLFTSADSWVVGCFDRLMYAVAEIQHRCSPALHTLPDGSVCFSNANMTRGLVEIYRGNPPAPGELPQFELVYVGLPFTPISDPFDPPDAPSNIDLPKPSITVDHLGHVLVCAGTDGVVSYDNGRTWVSRNDQRLPIALGTVQTTGIFTSVQHNKTRQVAGFGGARLFSTCINSAGDMLGTFVARDWTTGDSVFLPVHPTRPFWAGVDTLQPSFAGDPEPGDLWTIAPRYQYPIGNIFVASPKVMWRSTALSFLGVTIGQEVVFTAPAGKLFDASAFMLVGCNFRELHIATSLYGFPTEFTTKVLQGEVDTGMAAALSSSTYAVVRDSQRGSTLAPWDPHIFAPGSGRQYYCTINDVEGTVRVYKILDNSHDCLELDTTDVPPIPADTETRYIIWCDVHVWDGSDGTSPDGDNDLNTTAYRFCKTIKLNIPDQPTAEGFMQIGTAIIGVMLDATTPATETEDARLFSPDWLHSTIPNTAEELGLEGDSNVEHFGQLQKWTLPFEAVPFWYRQRLVAILSRRKRIRDAIGFVPDPDYPAEARLVRCLNQIDQRSVGVDHANMQIELVELPL